MYMPYKKKYNNSKNNKSYRKNNGKNGKSYQSKLSDKKINTLVEKRMQEIARKEDNKNIVRQVLRQFPNGSYNYVTNAYTYATINHSGSCTEVCQIVKSDGIGSRDVMGTRAGNALKIQSFQLLVRCQLPESSSGSDLAPIRYSNLAYSLVAIYDDWNFTGSGYTVNPVTITDCLPWFPFGYTPKIDTEVKPSADRRKVVKLLSGTVQLKASELYADTDTIKEFKQLKESIEMLYLLSDSSTQQKPENWKFFLSFRTNVPDAESDDLKPRIVSCLKTFYTEP